MATLPTYTRTVDDAFTNTWVDIRPTVIDNILLGTPIWALLKMRGCFKTQVGGDFIVGDQVRYGTTPVQEIAKGDILPQGEPALDTVPMWTWRHLATHIQRNDIDDQKNNGKMKIKSYVQARLESARDALSQDYEVKLLRAVTTDESGKGIQGLNDIVPPYASRATGTYGKIARSNSWWQPKYKALTSPTEVNLIDDMRNLYNTVGDNIEPPDVILTNQTMYELYESFALDQSQIIKRTSFDKADLGFEATLFKGKDMVWTPNITTNSMMFLNTKYIKVVYDPGMWFRMSEWKPIALQLDRIAHIVCAMNITSNSLRRHGLLYTA